MNRLLTSAACTIFMTMLPELILAQESNLGSQGHVERIVISASPLGSTDLHLAQPVTVLSGEELERNMSSSVGETLSKQLGISSTAFGAGASRPVIRGQSASRVKMLESGISSMDVSNLSPDHATSIEPLVATQIEVLKGPSTLLYGSGASGGVVNVVTKRIPSQQSDFPEINVRALYDSVSKEKTAAFSVESGVDQFAFHLDGSDRSTSDYKIPGFGSFLPSVNEVSGTLLSSDLETSNLNGGLSYIFDEGYAGLGVGNYKTEYGIPGEGARIQLKQSRYDLKGERSTPLGYFEKIKFQLGNVDYEHKEFEPSGDVGTTFLNDEYEGRLELLHNPIFGWHGALGVQLGHRDFSAIGEESLTPALLLNSQGVFLVEEMEFENWHLEFGGRIEQQRIKPKDSSPQSKHSVLSLSTGAIWEFSTDYSLALYLSSAQRAPSLEELYNNGPHEATETFEKGDISLKKETANNVDVSFSHQANDWDWQVNLFINHIQDYIHGQNVDSNNDGLADLLTEEGDLSLYDEGLLLINYAQQDAKFYGIEAQTHFNISEGNSGNGSSGRLDGHLSFDYVRAKLNDGSNLPRITPMRFGAGVDYHNGNWTANLDVFRVFEQRKNAVLERQTGGYNLLEASLSYLLTTDKGEYEVSVRGRNLLDDDVRLHTSFLKDVAPLPGRGISISLQASL